MEHLITFLSMLGSITLFVIILLFISRVFSILKKKEPMKLTKSKIWGLTKSTLHLTILIFLFRLSIMLGGWVWIVFTIYMFITNLYDDKLSVDLYNDN